MSELVNTADYEDKIDIELIQENKDFVIERLKVKRFDASQIVEKIVALDNQRKALQTTSE